jgi:hypothetical protein
MVVAVLILSRVHLESVVVGAPANFVFTMREEKRRESSLDDATREFSPKEGRKKTKREGKIEEFNARRMSSTKE